MAKSKNGGTRSFIKGRIGSDVYSVGKDGKGSRQQVVRSLAEQVSNPRTQAQMQGRMIMSTVMQTVASLSAIIDHSFDGLPKGQPSISEFIRRNYALIKADVAAHPSTGNSFGMNKYQEKNPKGGAYVIAAGSAVLPTAVVVDASTLMINLTADTLTVGGLKAALGLSADGYLTYVGIRAGEGGYFFRVRLTTTLADSTAITSSNVGSLFTFEGNIAVAANLETNSIWIAPTDGNSFTSRGIIVSEKSDGKWIHNNCVMQCSDNPAFAADTALPTYPTGVAQFLNGGDL